MDLDETCQIFDSFLKQVMKVDFNSCVALVETLYKSGREGTGNKYLSLVLQDGLVVNVCSYHMMIDCFCKAKMMDRTSETFTRMSQRDILPRLVTYSTLIVGIARLDMSSRHESCC